MQVVAGGQIYFVGGTGTATDVTGRTFVQHPDTGLAGDRAIIE